MANWSPIEEMLFNDLSWMEASNGGDSPHVCANAIGARIRDDGCGHSIFLPSGERFDLLGYLVLFDALFIVVRGVEFIGYKPDLMFMAPNGWSMAVECDGFDWHDRTKQQASSDRARDRAFLVAGVPTIRFTGSDIYRDTRQCSLEAIQSFRSYCLDSLTKSERQLASMRPPSIDGVSAGLVG